MARPVVEGLEGEHAFAGVFRRGAAAYADTCILVGWGMPVLVLETMKFVSSGNGVGLLLLGLCFLTVPFLYFALFEWSPLQATLGKLIAGVYVANVQGERISALRSLARTGLKYVVSWIPVVNVLGVLAAFFNERKQTLYDMFAGTLVLRASGAGFVRGVLTVAVSTGIFIAGMSVFASSYLSLYKRFASEQEAKSSAPAAPAATTIAAPAPPAAAAAAEKASGTDAPAAKPLLPSTEPPMDEQARRQRAEEAARALRAAVEREAQAAPKKKPKPSPCVIKPIMTDEDLARCR
ncbi:MAG: RDD family protein [Betaproteobacteria bacterium]|nr:RDD family protein [Betaproteobacteria bacterium]